MNLKTWFLTACAVAFAPAVLAQSQSSEARQDAKILRDLAHASMVEVEAGKIAESRARSDAVKNFARQMVSAHGRQLDELKRVNQRIKTELPEAPDRAHVSAMQRLESASSSDFDRLYMQQMVDDHRATLRLAEDGAREAQDPQLKAAAQNAVPEIRQHLAQAERLAASAASGGSTGLGSGRYGSGSYGAADRGDAKILRDLAHISMVESEAGKIAATKARSDAVKSFARNMAASHDRQLDQLKRVNQGTRTELPEAPDRAHVGAIRRLESASSNDFDRVFLDQMVDEHRNALRIAEDAAREAQDPQLKTAAQSAVTLLRRDLARAERLAATAAGGR